MFNKWSLTNFPFLYLLSFVFFDTLKLLNQCQTDRRSLSPDLVHLLGLICLRQCRHILNVAFSLYLFFTESLSACMLGRTADTTLKNIYWLFSLFWTHFGLSIYISLDFVSLVFSPNFLSSSFLLSFPRCYQSNIRNLFLPFSFNSVWKSLSTFLAVLWNNCSYRKMPKSSR